MAKKKKEDKWEHSKAKKLLFDAIVDKRVALESGPGMWPRHVYAMFAHLPEFNISDFNDKDMFGGRLRGVRKQVAERQYFAVSDALAFEVTRKKHPKQSYWNGSEAHLLLKADMDAGKHKEMTPSQLRDLPGRELYKTVSLEVFRKAIHAEAYSRKGFKNFKNTEGSISNEEEEENIHDMTSMEYIPDMTSWLH